jgi:hypothetical protein
MDITRAGSKPSGKGPADWFTGISASTHSSPRRRRPALAVQLSLSNPALGLLGTRIRLVKP